MSLLFKTNNNVAFASVNDNIGDVILNKLNLNDFDVKKVKMEGGGSRVKYTCLVSDIKFDLGAIDIYLDKGFIIYKIIK